MYTSFQLNISEYIHVSMACIHTYVHIFCINLRNNVDVYLNLHTYTYIILKLMMMAINNFKKIGPFLSVCITG